MLAIRLQRTGKRNRPEFRVVVAPKTAAAQKHFLEVLGSFNPRTKQFVAKDPERIKYWLGQNIRLSPTAHNLFVTNGFISSAKVKAFSIPAKPTEPVKAEEVKAAEEKPAEVKVEKVAEESSEGAAPSTEETQTAEAAA